MTGNRFKAILLPIFAAAILAGSYLLPARRGSGAESLPNRPDVETQIQFWQKRISANPRGYIEYTYLGEAYARKARETGDVSYFQRAEEALGRSLEINSNYAQSSAVLANVLFAMHDFTGALALAQPLAESPRTYQALAVAGDANFALGNYPEAEAAYQKLHQVFPSPASYSRLAILSDLKGDPGRAIDLMKKASELAGQFGDYPESLAWYEFQVGELYFKNGRFAQAKEHYLSSLKLFHKGYMARSGLGKVYAALGDLPRAIDSYEQAAAIIPQPDLLAALGDLYTLAGQPEKAGLQYDTVIYTGKLAAINQQIYNRQLANFYSDHDIHLDEALRLAAAELEQRKDIYGYDAAAWAYYKNGMLEQAQHSVELARQYGTRDARIAYHAGMIALARGKRAEARRLLEEALSTNPQFDILQAAAARETLQQLKAQ